VSAGAVPVRPCSLLRKPSHARAGFAPYQLDPAAGQALFLQKWL
jgi:hypothetical protein